MPGEGPLRVGILGLGLAGQRLIPAIGRTPDAQLAAVADIDQETLATVATGTSARPHATASALFADPNVELVYIATPTPLHEGHVLAAIEHGKHVIVEKPMAIHLDAAQRMIDAAERARVMLMVGHSQSYEPPIRAMRELVAGGSLGALTMINTWYYTDWLYRPRLPAELDTRMGGGVVFRQGAHQVDLIRWIGGGMLRSVRATTSSSDPARPTEGSHTMFLEFESGASATAVFSGYDYFHTHQLTGVGEDGRPPSARPGSARRAAASSANDAARKRSRPPISQEPPPHASMYGLTIVSCERGDIREVPVGLEVSAADGQRFIPVPAIRDGRDFMLREAVTAIRNGTTPANAGRWAMATLEVCLAALESARTHREITLHQQVTSPSFPLPLDRERGRG
jgi:phthalate 4,5-cis-dihydrodiol dehydrogenase